MIATHCGAAAVDRRISAASADMHAPHILEIEVANVLRKFALRGLIDGSRGALALEMMRDFGIKLYPHSATLPRVWALRHNVSAYDAAYVALAELLDAPLLTCDGRLAMEIGHHATVEIIKADENF